MSTARQLYRLAFATVLFGFLSIGRPAASHADAVDAISVTRAGVDSLSVQPGGIVTAAFVVTNSSDSSRTFTTATQLPAGWKLVSSRVHDEEILPGTSRTVLVSIMVDRQAVVDNYTVKFNVADVNSPATSDESSVVVSVERHDKLEISVFEVPPFVTAGETYDVRLLLVNEGNAVANIVADAMTVPLAATSVSPSRIAIQPNGEAIVVISVESDQALPIATRQLLQFTVRTEDKPEVIKKESVWIDLVPLGKKAKKGTTIPAYVRATGLHSNTGQAGQLELGLKGHPVEGSKQFVDVMIRTPDLASSYLFGRRDEYRLTYGTDRFFVRLGDHSFALSPLTEYGRMGRGAGIGASSRRVTAEVYASRNRVIFPRENQLGGTVTFELNKYADFSANYLSKSGATEGQSISIRTRVYPLDGTTLDLEVGDGTVANAQSSAYSFRAQSNTRWYSFNGRVVRTGPEFPGYYSDYENISSSLVLKASKGLKLQGIVQRQDRRFDNSISGSVETENTYFEVGPLIETDALGFRVNFSANYLNRSTSSTSSLSTFDQEESLMRLSASATFWKFTVGSRYETGNVASDALAQQLSAQKLEISTAARFSRCNYHVALERQTGATLFRLQDRKLTVLRVGGSGRIARNTRLHMNAFSVQDPAYSLGQYSFLQGGVKHQFSFGHILEIDASTSAVDSWLRNSHPDVSVSYQVPLGIPRFGSKRTRLVGRVVDTGTGSGLKGIRVTMGTSSTVTNADGEYFIDKPAAGKYYIVVDQAAIGIDKTTTVPNPIPVSIDRETRQLPTIGVSQSGSIDGQVVYEHAAPGKPQGVSHAIVEIYDSVGKFRVVAGEDGTFKFSKLRPGEWKARVVYANARSGYELRKSEYNLEVLPGETARLVIEYVKQSRSINFVARGVAGKIEAPDTTPVSDTDLAADDVKADSLQGAQTTVCVPYTGDRSTTHNVAQGQTLAEVVNIFYCDGIYWPRVWLRNRAILSRGTVSADEFVLTIPSVKSFLQLDRTQGAFDILDHEVVAGESLSSLADSYYGDLLQWPRIWLVNRRIVSDPDVIYPGMILRVPPRYHLAGEEIEFLKTDLRVPESK